MTKFALAAALALAGVLAALAIAYGAALVALIHFANCSAPEYESSSACGSRDWLFVAQALTGILGAVTLAPASFGPVVKEGRGRLPRGYGRVVAGTAVLLGAWALTLALALW